ncbi:hypothetical protein O181_023148 [Austropuccinia psidii MF-1]|uniref:Uncharacterized protein n=1 Tax=Austropuccinia psidii MF-1 TaxID=1389203 RepID=A0A9Q3CI89_9BASI|nr:hypothetical protein [Austropuccinia psidii MF-1]
MLGHRGEWKDTQGDHSHHSINLLVQQTPQPRRLERHGLSSSISTTPQVPFSMKPGTHDIQAIITPARTWSKMP